MIFSAIQTIVLFRAWSRKDSRAFCGSRPPFHACERAGQKPLSRASIAKAFPGRVHHDADQGQSGWTRHTLFEDDDIGHAPTFLVRREQDCKDRPQNRRSTDSPSTKGRYRGYGWSQALNHPIPHPTGRVTVRRDIIAAPRDWRVRTGTISDRFPAQCANPILVSGFKDELNIVAARVADRGHRQLTSDSSKCPCHNRPCGQSGKCVPWRGGVGLSV